MKLGFITDIHARLDSPSSRADFYPKSLFEKLEAVGNIWNTEKVDFVVHGGDLTHIPSPSLSLVHDLSAILKKWGKRIITVTGSHDIVGYQTQTIRRTAVGVLARAGVLEIFGTEGFPKYIDIGPFRIYGMSHTPSLTDSSENLRIMDPERGKKFIIEVVHGDLLDHPVPWPYLLVEQIATSAHLVLSGHYHPGWKKPIVGNGTVFINPGSFGRVERGPFRIPRVLIIDSDNPEDFHFIDIPCIEHPFKEAEQTTKEEVVVDINRFLSLFESAQVEVVDIKAKVPIIAKELGLSEEVVERTIQLLEEEK